MKRFAYLLSNNYGLSGIKKDIKDIQTFLESCEGGAWNTEEIQVRTNPSLFSLRQDIACIKASRYDYVLFYYSGHGSYTRGNILEINNTESIYESETLGLAVRQFSIYDCCRFDPARVTKKMANACDEALNSSDLLHQLSRRKFDRLIQEAPPQQLSVYACQIGEYATATHNGSIYTQALLIGARTKCLVGDVDAVDAHDSCILAVSLKARAYGVDQHPDISCRPTVALPFAIAKPTLMFG